MDTMLPSDISYAAIAREMGVSGEAVRKWFLGEFPPERVLPYCRAVGWRKTPHQLRPDIYPNPTDGLPQKEAA